jgi:hypothetical protein
MSTSADSRLDRVLPGLTFDERLDAVLAAYREDRRTDPSLLATMPASDNRRWNEVGRIVKGLHVRLGWYIHYVEACLTQLELRQTIAVQGRYILELWGSENRESLESAAERLTVRIVEEFVARWREIRLAELVAEHFSERLGGRQPLHPLLVDMLADCRTRMLELHDEIASSYEFDLTEPSQTDFATSSSNRLRREERITPSWE